MTEARWSVVALAILIFGGVTVIFGGILQDYPLAAGAGLIGALGFGGIAFFLANDGDKHIHDPTQGD
jgi:hypothetical protein